MSADTNLLIVAEKLMQGQVAEVKHSDFVSDIKSRKYEFVAVIESLSDILTNQDVTVRGRGVDFLTWILTEIPPDFFNAQEISAVVSFYCVRLKDHPSIAPATIKGLLALVKMKNIEKESLVKILMPLFRETDCQVLDKSDRYNIFSIVAYLVENHFEVVATMGFDFVFGIISIADGETDPLNLLLLFRFLPSFLKNINLGHLMEETFDLLSCYFPIDYDAATENSSVTRKDLTQGLTNCLVARSDFADLCIPLIFDKLDSTAKSSKVDSYVLLGAACSSFPAESVSKRSNEIWKIMQKDLLPPKDPAVGEIALNTLSEVVKLFASSESDQQVLYYFLDDIVNSVKKFLNVEHHLYNHVMNILMAVSSKSIPAAEYVIINLKFVVGDVFIRTTKRMKIALSSLAPFLPIIKSCRIARSNQSDLVTLFHIISKFYITAIDDEPDVQRLALLGLIELVDDFNDDTLRNELLAAALAVAKTERDDNRVEFLMVLRKLARVAPSEMLHFVKNFPLRTGPSKEKIDLKALAFTFCAIAREETITEYAITQLIDIITTSEYFEASLSYLLKSMKMIEDDEFVQKMHTEYNMTETLITWWIDGLPERKLVDDKPIKYLSEIVALIVRCQETSIQISIADKLIPLLLPGVESGSSESNVFLIEAILSSAEHVERFDQLPLLGSTVINLAIKSNNETVRKSSSRLLASIVNKLSDSLPKWLSKACDEIFSSLNDADTESDKERGVCLLTWIAKGLVLADSPHLVSFIPKWFQLMERNDIGLSVANGFDTVLEDDGLYLNIESHCNVKILYRQKFFTYFPVLMRKFESSPSPAKTYYLLSLVHLIKSVPKHVALTEITNIVIVLSEALDTGMSWAIIVCTSVLQQFLKDKEAILVNYVFTFIPKLLRLSKVYGQMDIRISALKCLYLYAYYPTVSILPLRKEVISCVQGCLDDKKRLVRNEAVKSINRWFLVGAPGEDDIFS